MSPVSQLSRRFGVVFDDDKIVPNAEFVSDIDVLGAGSTLHRLGYRWFSQSRLGEWLRSLNDADIDGFADALTEVTDAAWRAGLGPDLNTVSAANPLAMDLDSTFTETYGIPKDGTADATTWACTATTRCSPSKHQPVRWSQLNLAMETLQ